MRITLELDDEAIRLAEQFAMRNRITLDMAVSHLTLTGAKAPIYLPLKAKGLRGRFALLPMRDEIITPDHVSKLMQSDVS